MDPEKFFQVVRDDGRRGHSFKLFNPFATGDAYMRQGSNWEKRGAVWK